MGNDRIQSSLVPHGNFIIFKELSKPGVLQLVYWWSERPAFEATIHQRKEQKNKPQIGLNLIGSWYPIGTNKYPELCFNYLEW